MIELKNICHWIFDLDNTLYPNTTNLFDKIDDLMCQFIEENLGVSKEEALKIKNSDIAEELALPPVKIHCSVLAEDAIKAALADYKGKQESIGKWQPNSE